ncbi:excisionase family DNA-binding protein [Rubripirellula amarantea]|nr:excisionase family DNA-binding protein [Rubripirellula amarantea]
MDSVPLSPVEMELLADMVAERVADRLSNQRKLLSRQELSEVIGVSVPKLDTMLRDNELPVIRVGRKVLFDPHAVIKHLAESSRVTLVKAAND